MFRLGTEFDPGMSELHVMIYLFRVHYCSKFISSVAISLWNGIKRTFSFCISTSRRLVKIGVGLVLCQFQNLVIS